MTKKVDLRAGWLWRMAVCAAMLLTLMACSAAPEATPTAAPQPTLPPPTATPVPQPTATAAPSPTPPPTAVPVSLTFDGSQALTYLEEVVAFGPRYPGSEGHLQVREYIVTSLEQRGWQVERQGFEYKGFSAENLIGKANVGVGPIIILGGHYDTRAVSDQSFGRESEPSVSAVDGGSSTAVLLEFARSLDLDKIEHEVWLAFFDVEDNGSGGLEDWDWIVGSAYMAENLVEPLPEAMVLVDMIGDADQQLFYEGNSDVALREELWGIAANLGFSQWYIPELKYTMIDDHVPFMRRGIPSVDIIDFDYPYWHTVEDTVDKASADSLFRAGRVVEVWIENK